MLGHLWKIIKRMDVGYRSFMKKAYDKQIAMNKPQKVTRAKSPKRARSSRRSSRR